jgi:hypothetical protein
VPPQDGGDSLGSAAVSGGGRATLQGQRTRGRFPALFPLAALRGPGEKASADMISLDACKHRWNARVGPRRRTYAAGLFARTGPLRHRGRPADRPERTPGRCSDPARDNVACMSAGGAMAAVLVRDYPRLYPVLGVHSGAPAGLAHDVYSGMRLMSGGPRPSLRLDLLEIEKGFAPI